MSAWRLRWLGVMVLLLSASLHAADRPNIILMMADDLGWGDVGFNGNRTIRTPHLDAMAAAGLKFNRFYAAAPVCSPTRGSALTGRHPMRYGITNANAGHMPAEELTLAELLKKHGYITGHFGKWHLGVLTTTERDANRGGRPKGAEHYAPPWEHGFDVCFSTESKVPTWNPMIKRRGASESGLWPAELAPDESVAYGTAYWIGPNEKARENLGGDDSRVIMDRVVPFVELAAAGKKPFLAVIWFHAPHLPVIAGQKYLDMYPVARSELHRHYYGCITAMDEQVGRLRETLDRLNVADNTLIFFCSDNGPEGREDAPGRAGPFQGRKRDLLEGGVRVPAFAVWPGRINPGSVTDVPAVTSDYMPTVADILDVTLPAEREIDGMSILPLLEGRMTERRKPIGFYFKNESAWHDGKYKLASLSEEKYGPHSIFMFNLAEDPGENMRGTFEINRPRDLDVRFDEMLKQLAAWKQAVSRDAEGN